MVPNCVKCLHWRIFSYWSKSFWLDWWKAKTRRVVRWILNMEDFLSSPYLLDTGRKSNVHKTFRVCGGRFMNVLCVLNLHPVSRGQQIQLNSTNFNGPLNCPTTDYPIWRMRFLAYSDIYCVVILDQNYSALSEDQNYFKEFLLRCQNGDEKLSDWELLNTQNIQNISSEGISNFTQYWHPTFMQHQLSLMIC